ncbi:squalene cyclase [Bradyrhizobium sp. LHD-71]|uniref:squalene cyclase n=1 Tax=Bradyrhizobium sp. LHD-71 TaxID=3072141 RepID=UPI00280E800C|nr:squalene cyclase [Bradyrhizobium sp. LHD-71]MDQ8730901.1 squalene cyclase [Bradyrhizobium sp. LHD-71]
MDDLLDGPEDGSRLEQTKIETHGWGGRLFELQDNDGQWAGGAFVPAGFTEQKWREEGQPWTATCWTLAQLREFGLDPGCACARRTVRLIGENSRWDHDGERYWDGEVEECINGRTIADGAYFGVDISPIVQRLLNERQQDGGWNCERANGSRVSSFDTTISVLEGLLEYERRVGVTPQTRAARRGGENYLLSRRLFRRLSTGEIVDTQYLEFSHPNHWRYDILRALDYFRSASKFDQSEPDQRLAEAIAQVRRKQQADGRWLMDWKVRGRRWFELDPGPGQPSRWITLRALRILKWWEAAQQ